MKAKILSIAAAVLMGLLLAQPTAQAQPQRGPQRLRPQTTGVTPAVEQALILALAGPDGEYAAYAEYAAIIEAFGEVQPFASIIRAEERHIAALKRQFELRGLSVPENPYLGRTPAPSTLKEAADAGIVAEEKNIAMYDQLLVQVTGQPDLMRVFTHLQFASREHHLPAFKAAAANDGLLEAGEVSCGTGCGRQRGGPPAWTGGRGRGLGQGASCGSCINGAPPQAGESTEPGPGRQQGAANRSQR